MRNVEHKWREIWPVQKPFYIFNRKKDHIKVLYEAALGLTFSTK